LLLCLLKLKYNDNGVGEAAKFLCNTISRSSGQAGGNRFILPENAYSLLCILQNNYIIVFNNNEYCKAHYLRYLIVSIVEVGSRSGHCFVAVIMRIEQYKYITIYTQLDRRTTQYIYIYIYIIYTIFEYPRTKYCRRPSSSCIGLRKRYIFGEEQFFVWTTLRHCIHMSFDVK